MILYIGPNLLVAGQGAGLRRGGYAVCITDSVPEPAGHDHNSHGDSPAAGTGALPSEGYK